MVTVTAPQEKEARIAARAAEVAPLKARCAAARVNHDAIAARLKCTRPYVVNVFAGRNKATDKFVDAAVWLCERAERKGAKKRTNGNESSTATAGRVERPAVA